MPSRNPNAVKNLKPLVKGYDPRRNVRGVPKDAIAARKSIRKIGAELLRIKEKQENGEVVEYDITRFEAMIRLMFNSKSPVDRQTLLKALAPGLLKEELELSGDVSIKTLVWPGVDKTRESD